METKIFESYSAFLKRTDKTVNGVSPEFARKNPGFAKDNETNVGCWECISCTECQDCIECIKCNDCKLCHMCNECETCIFCDRCENCTYCRQSTYCSHCRSCFDCHDSECLENESGIEGDEPED